MPIVPYIPLSEMIMIGLAPYWRAVAISFPVIKAPPSPTNATICVPGRRNAAATACQYGAAPIMIISDNAMYGTIGMHSYVRYPERPFMEGTRLTNPDFAAWGRSFGAEGITIKSESEVAGGIARAFAVRTKPVVVHCLTSAIQMSAWRRYTRPEALP